MHSKGKGISASALPYRRSQPTWSKTTPEEVCDQIFKLARRGLSPSQIGVVLRDSQGVPQVKSVTGNKILRILKTNGELGCPASYPRTGVRWRSTMEGSKRDVLVEDDGADSRSCPFDPRGPLPPHQEGRVGPQAPRAQPW